VAFSAFATATATEQAPRRASKVALLLLLPGIAYLMLFFLVPLFSLVITSLQAPAEFGDIGEYNNAFRWENYTTAIGQYSGQILRSFVYAVLATIFALLFSYPLAYFIGVRARPYPLLQKLILVMVIAPFFISFLLRTLAWKQILSDESPVVAGLKALSLYASLERLDTRYLEAGSDLYSTPFTTFRTVTIPLSMPGIVSGVLLTFIPAAGDYVNASREFLGGTGTTMIGNVIESNFLISLNYPAAASLSIILMAVILVLVTAYVKRSGTEDLL